METHAAQLTATPPELMPALARFAVAVVVATVLSATWITAEHESHGAVQVTGWALSGGAYLAKLPTMQVRGQKA